MKLMLQKVVTVAYVRFQLLVSGEPPAAESIQM